jgi:hypothetical protein
MTRKIHKRSKVSRTESTNEPRQPSRLEKKRNTHAGCPAGHGPTRGVSGVSGSTTLFHMLAQTRLSSSPPCTTGGTVINEDLVDAQLHAAPAMELVMRGREQSRAPRSQHRKKIVPSAGPRSRESPDVPQPTCGPHLAVMSESAPSGDVAPAGACRSVLGAMTFTAMVGAGASLVLAGGVESAYTAAWRFWPPSPGR